MTERKFYKLTLVIEVLCEESCLDCELKDIVEADGCSIDVKSEIEEEIDGATAAKLLIEQRSEPGFFNIDSKGNDLEDDE